MTEPVSWLQIEQGWNVTTSDGVIVGTVAQIEGDKQNDIFDGLAVESRQPRQLRYVPGEQRCTAAQPLFRQALLEPSSARQPSGDIREHRPTRTPALLCANA